MFMRILLLVSTIIFGFSEVSFLNVFSITANKNKLFKNIVFFGTFAFIYMTGTFSREMLNVAYTFRIDPIFIVLTLNIVISILLFGITKNKLNTISNETILKSKGEWI